MALWRNQAASSASSRVGRAKPRRWQHSIRVPIRRLPSRWSCSCTLGMAASVAQDGELDMPTMLNPLWPDWAGGLLSLTV